MSEQKPRSENPSEQIEFINEGELTIQELYEVLDMLAENLIVQNTKKQSDQTEMIQKEKSL